MRRLIYNDDSQGVSEARPGHARQDLEAWVDKPLSRLPIDTYAWCIAFPDVCMHRTAAGEIYGARFPEPPNAAAAAIAELHGQGTDVLEVVAARARHHGAEFVASVRMNDTHGMFPDPSDPQMSQFLMDHPEYVIKRSDGIPERALDYAILEVRAHRLAIIEELARAYDIDGVELDFTRWAKLFAREEAPLKAPILTEFVGEVRRVLDEAASARGRDRLTLGVQVLESLHLNLLAGMDPKAWVDNGWVDFLIQCDFNCTNPQIPTGELAAFLRDTSCTHHVRMGNMMGGAWSGKPHVQPRTTAAYKGNPSYGGMVLTPEEARGAAANIYGFGADGVGLWNICCNLGDRHKAGATGPDRRKFQEDMMAWIEAVASPEVAWSGTRHYHFVPIYKKAELPLRNYPVNALRMSPTGAAVQIVHFWANSCGFRQAFRFLMADGQSGESLEGLMRWRVLGATLEDAFDYDVNGEPISGLAVRRTFEADEELPHVWHEACLGDLPGFAGDNELGITPASFGPGPRGSASEPYLEELEVIVTSTASA
ncbi:hypothetical protein ACFL6X_02905 [Candidatus Latescibacterota bacterium]